MFPSFVHQSLALLRKGSVSYPTTDPNSLAESETPRLRRSEASRLSMATYCTCLMIVLMAESRVESCLNNWAINNIEWLNDMSLKIILNHPAITMIAQSLLQVCCIHIDQTLWRSFLGRCQRQWLDGAHFRPPSFQVSSCPREIAHPRMLNLHSPLESNCCPGFALGSGDWELSGICSLQQSLLYIIHCNILYTQHI